MSARAFVSGPIPDCALLGGGVAEEPGLEDASDMAAIAGAAGRATTVTVAVEQRADSAVDLAGYAAGSA